MQTLRQDLRYAVRLALRRASGRYLVRGVVRHSLAMAGAGLVIGAAGAVMRARLLEGFLVGVSAFDPLTIAGWCVVLIVVALIASYLPARRATRIDPAAVLIGPFMHPLTRDEHGSYIVSHAIADARSPASLARQRDCLDRQRDARGRTAAPHPVRAVAPAARHRIASRACSCSCASASAWC